MEELASRSIYNRFENVMTFLKVYGITSATLHFRKGDWPIFMKTEPEIYEREVLDKFFATCDEEERLLFETFLYSGFRKNEIAHCTMKDISFADCTIKVSHKPEYGWTPKAYKERTVPVPPQLIAKLTARSGDGLLIFYAIRWGGTPLP